MRIRNPKTGSQARRFTRIAAILLLGLAALCPASLLAAPSKWETIKSERSDLKSVAKDGDIEIKVAKGVVVISSPRPLAVKVYSILGQLISKENLPAGTSQFSVQAHGVYIIRTGDLTCKVAL